MNARSLHLRIDRIALEGLSDQARRRFPSALESALGKLDASAFERSAASGRFRISNVDAGRIPSDATAERAAGMVVDGIRRNLSGRIGGGGHV